MGAQIVLWPTDMGTPDRTMNSYAALHRYHWVGNGQPGGIFTDFGPPVGDIKYLPGGDPRHSLVTTGTIDLDATWFHENGPYQCDKVVELCDRYPGNFHFLVPGCNNGARQHHPPNASNCTAAPQMPIPGWHPVWKTPFCAVPFLLVKNDHLPRQALDTYQKVEKKHVCAGTIARVCLQDHV